MSGFFPGGCRNQHSAISEPEERHGRRQADEETERQRDREVDRERERERDMGGQNREQLRKIKETHVYRSFSYVFFVFLFFLGLFLEFV